MSIKVGINGFGRIGRCLFRNAISNKDIDIVMINDLTSAKTLAHLLKFDSVHGILSADVKSEEDAIIVNGKKIRISACKEPELIPWEEEKVDIVIESTGLFLNRDKASRHLRGKVKKVIISAPAKEPDVTIVLGVNEDQYDPLKHNIISNASCTTNCLAPIAKILLEKFGIKRGLMTTIHSYTNDQRILDLPHKDLRRARAANISMIPTTTGAARAVSLVIPELKGRLDGLAIRVPTPNVSLVDLVAETEKDTSAEEINKTFKESSEGRLKGILAFSEEPLVSIDFSGNPASSVVDGHCTSMIENRMLKVLSWYDNECGYSARIKDLILFLGEKGL